MYTEISIFLSHGNAGRTTNQRGHCALGVRMYDEHAVSPAESLGETDSSKECVTKDKATTLQSVASQKDHRNFSCAICPATIGGGDCALATSAAKPQALGVMPR